MGGLFGGGGSASSAPAPQRLSGVRMQSSTFGLPKQIVYGRHRITGNILWYGDFVATAQTAFASGLRWQGRWRWWRRRKSSGDRLSVQCIGCHLCGLHEVLVMCDRFLALKASFWKTKRLRQV